MITYRLIEMDEDHINILNEEDFVDSREAIQKMIEIAKTAAILAFNDILIRYQIDKIDSIDENNDENIF